MCPKNVRLTKISSRVTRMLIKLLYEYGKLIFYFPKIYLSRPHIMSDVIISLKYHFYKQKSQTIKPRFSYFYSFMLFLPIVLQLNYISITPKVHKCFIVYQNINLCFHVSSHSIIIYTRMLILWDRDGQRASLLLHTGL